MAKEVKRSDVTEDDIFRNARESALNTIKVVEKLNGEFKESASLLKNDIKNAKFGNSAEIEKFVKATQKAQKLQKESIQLKKVNKDATDQLTNANEKLAKSKAAEMKTERELLKETRLLNTEKERGKKAAEKQAKAIKDETSEYKKLVKKTRDQKNASKELAAQLLKLESSGGKNTKQWRKMRDEYNRTTNAAKKGDKALKKIDGTVGDNFRNVGNYKSALGGLTRALSGLGLAFGGLSIVKGAGQTIVEFDKNIQDLRAITGASGADLEFFKEQAKSLGTEVEGGASAVIEAYKLIGSAKPELLGNAQALDAVTQSAITLSQASGLDLPEAATRLTDAMNQFGAPAEEAGKFINVLANGALFGSAAIPDVTDALLKFGAAANTSNVSLEESTALIEALASKGLKGAEAGTALRNVMLKLSAPDALPKEAQKAMAALGISFDDITDTSKPFSERLEALKPLLNDNGALIKVFGKENSIAATNLLNMTDEVADLTQKMETQGTVQEQAAKNTDTVAFAFNKLKETWNKFILDLDQGAGIGEKLKDLLGFLAENLETIVKTLGFAVKAFVAYKTIVKITAIQNKILASSFGDLVKSKNGIKGAFGAMKAGIKGVGKALKANALGIALTALAWSLNAIRGESERLNAVLSKTADNQKELDAATAEVTTNLKLEQAEAKGLFEALGETNRESADRARLMQEINDKYGLALTNMESEKDFNEQNAAALKLVNDELEKKAKLAAAQIGFEITQKQAVEAKLALEQADEALVAFRNSGTGAWLVGALFDRLGATSEQDLLDLANAAQEVSDTAREKAEEYEDAWINLQSTLSKKTDVPNPNPGGIPPKPGEPGYVAPPADPVKFIDLLRKIEDEQIKQIADDEERQIKKLEATQRRAVEDVKKQNTYATQRADFIRELEETLVIDVQKVRDAAEAKRTKARQDANKALIAAQIAQKNIEIGSIEDTAENEGVIESKQDELDRLLIMQIQYNADVLLLTEEDAGKREEIVKNAELAILNVNKAADERELALHRKQFERLTEQMQREYDEYYLKLLQTQEKGEFLTQAEIDKRMVQFEIEQLQKRIKILKEKYPELEKEILALEIQLEEKQRKQRLDAEKKTNEDLEDAQKKHLQRIADTAKAITDVYTHFADRRIAKIEEEISKAEEQKTHLEKLAAEGNIKASESLAEQNRIIADANRQKEKEEKRKRTAELINAAVQTYTAKAADPNVEHPLLETIRDITLLTQFISNMPAFLEGTENTGTNGQGIDGKGGFHAILHPNERVLTKEQNAMVGELSNVELAKVAAEYNTGKMINGGNSAAALQIGGPWEQTAVIEQLQSLEETIKSNNTTFGVEDTLNEGFQWFTRTQKGNNVNFNRYKVKK
jgi:TP901 family phage tail tape measure protein